MSLNRVFAINRRTVDSSKDSRTAGRLVGAWLLSCCLLIFLMVILGGVTRLTGSGLSMVNWQPLSGVIPPLSVEDWQVEFQNYQHSPEFKKVNFGISLESFKVIFYYEYAHRMLGRLIGLVFLVPFVLLWWQRLLAPALAGRLLIVFVLGGLQGLLGWYMVKSGLVDIPSVSPYRLTMHLALAVVLYSYLWWLTLSQLLDDACAGSAAWRRHTALSLSALVFLVVLTGGFVAGLKAGHAFNTFPLMAGQWLPPGYWALDPVWRNLFENIPAVQFNHRLLALVTLLLLVGFIVAAWSKTHSAWQRWLLLVFGGVALAQVVLGVTTLLLHVPVVLGAAHQAGALLLLTIGLSIAFFGRSSGHQRIREGQ